MHSAVIQQFLVARLLYYAICYKLRMLGIVQGVRQCYKIKKVKNHQNVLKLIVFPLKSRCQFFYDTISLSTCHHITD